MSDGPYRTPCPPPVKPGPSWWARYWRLVVAAIGGAIMVAINALDTSKDGLL